MRAGLGPIPSDWLSGEVEKQKRRDAEEMEQGVVVVEDDPEEVIGDDGEPKWMPGDPDDGLIVVPPATISPEAHRAFGVEQARKSLLDAWSLTEEGFVWLKAVGYRSEVRAEVVEVAGDLSHIVKLIEEWEGIER